MTAIYNLLTRLEGDARNQIELTMHQLIARVNIPYNSSSPPGLIEADTRDPFNKSGKYALGWVFFGLILLAFTSALYCYHAFTDRIRAAWSSHQYELFPRVMDLERETHLPRTQPTISGWRPLLFMIALFRFIFYRTIPDWRIHKSLKPIVFPPLSVLFIGFAGVAFSLMYTFVPQPLYWTSIQYGSPPVAIRSGMLAVALLPWVVAMAMKANFVSIITGIGPERLNVFHRWGSYLMLLLSLIHTIPFYITPITDARGVPAFKSFFSRQHFYVYGTGVAALVPLCFLVIHSLPIIRRPMYELFLVLHWPVGAVFVGTMFWHCNNYLTSYSYLYATVAIWLTSWVGRIFYTNFLNPRRMSWLIGDESAITLLPENAVKITVPTQMKWRPGQYVYIRMPGISIFENHPFTIASLCSDDFPSEYGEEYRDLLLVFRPFGGFTRKVVNTALEKGEWKTYRAFLDGPYGGMRRRIESFDKVVLIAGGSGITAIVSQLLDLIKRMRDGKAVTKDVQVIWALKRPETMEWFKEELRICRDCAPPESVRCQFFITSAKRMSVRTHQMTTQAANRHISTYLHDKVNDKFMDIAEKRASYHSKRNSAYIQEYAEGDENLEKELRTENEDVIQPLPKAHIKQINHPNAQAHEGGRDLALDIKTALASGMPDSVLDPSAADEGFNFGFPSTPTEFQKNLMRFAFLPAAKRGADGWSTEYGRPDLPYMLRQMSKSWGKRTCVFVCGPPSMRVTVASAVASLQSLIFTDPEKEEIFLHTENYAL
ncbi:hypothetical protein, variant [Verruconis gallopava]|uniref:ferric-chelate reductase (NADPH) n=1 Tax=Verruconis gallopava TaxID=253628 RepID=A0A0D2ASA6_9PEZI|nr:hypothetical protein, variant [Verruconis gallopava]KIW09410.1 hypothetical protein, variant [Verruconis gallopava]